MALVFNCTPQRPYGGQAFTRWVRLQALAKRGVRFAEATIKHDDDGKGRCPNCSIILDTDSIVVVNLLAPSDKIVRFTQDGRRVGVTTDRESR